MFPKSLYGFYRIVINKFRGYFASLFVLGVLMYVVDMVLFPFASKWAVDIFESAISGVFSYKIYWIFGIYISLIILSIAKQYLAAYAEPLVDRYTGFLLYSRVYDNDTDFFLRNPSGQTLKNVSIIKMNQANLTVGILTDLVKYILGIVMLVGTMFAMNWRIALFVAIVSVVRAAWRFLTQKRVNTAVKEQQAVNAKISGVRTDSLSNAMTVKMFDNIEYENKYIWHRQDESIDLAYRVAFLRRIQNIPNLIIWYSMMFGVIVMSAYFVSRGMITVADAMFAFIGARTISSAFFNLMLSLTKFSENKAAAQRAFDDVILPRAVVDVPHAKKLKRGARQISFENVSFNYGGRNVIHNLDLVIGENEKIGIVGLSGAGKTTLVNLLLRAYDVVSGAIKIDGTDIRDITQKSLRANIAVVPQDVALFNRSLIDNIRYGHPNASRRDCIDAARRAHIHDFIMSQPDGYDTLVGNRGIKLSGGQRQRIAIARAILKNSSILVLDEATSALDSKNEMLIQSALSRVMRGRTTIAIAHRLSTLRNMDRIIVLSRGKIIECGTHEELLSQGGAYKKLWDMQTNGFIS